MNLQWIENGEITTFLLFEYISTSYYNLCVSSISKYTINEKVFAKHRKIKEDINNKRFPLRVTHFTDLEIKYDGNRRNKLIRERIFIKST
jgi:hypothetical protein